MSRVARIDKEGYFYHIICRGQRKDVLFFSKDDMNEFCHITNYALSKTDISIIAYCLMNNHIHLLVKRNKIPLSRFMRILETTYAIYFNRKFNLVGHVFQGRYKAYIILDERHLYSIVQYIHYNPVVAEIVSKAYQYLYSSASIYQTHKKYSGIVIRKEKFEKIRIKNIEKQYNHSDYYIGTKKSYLEINKREKGREKTRILKTRKTDKNSFHSTLNSILLRYNLSKEDITNIRWKKEKIKNRDIIIKELNKAGFSQSTIAENLCYSKQLVSKSIKRS